MTSAPHFLLAKPTPTHIGKKFHGRHLLAWQGEAALKDIQGWVSNPRLDIELKKFRTTVAGRDPNQDEILEIMSANKDFRLKELAENIAKNGVHEPIILNYEGTLLDGNRRFFAVKYLISKTPAGDEKIADYARIPVIVLDENCSEDDENHVLVHTNFYKGLKEPWPDIVLARHIYSALESGESAKAVSQKYEWSVSKVNETKKIMSLIDEFLAWCQLPEPEGPEVDELEAESVAATNYQFFNEAQKSFFSPLQTNIDFKQDFFRWIFDSKFDSFQQVRVAWQAWNDAELRKSLKSNDPEAGEKVLAEVNYKKIVRTKENAAPEKIAEFEEFLKSMRTEDYQALQQSDVERLEEIVSVVSKMAKAAANTEIVNEG